MKIYMAPPIIIILPIYSAANVGIIIIVIVIIIGKTALSEP
jgi:hypothetical protein